LSSSVKSRSSARGLFDEAERAGCWSFVAFHGTTHSHSPRVGASQASKGCVVCVRCVRATVRHSVGAYVGAVHATGTTTHQQRPSRTMVALELGMLADQWAVDRGLGDRRILPLGGQPAPRKVPQDDFGPVGALTIKILPSLAPPAAYHAGRKSLARPGLRSWPAFLARLRQADPKKHC
jgi:hypothetical protein